MSFRFKQFYIEDSKCAMKVGTDGVLLGAWAPTNPLTTNPLTRILDVGTGSGLIALMLAQRFPLAQIDAIDMDEAAAEQASNNFCSSPWTERLHAYHSPFQEWRMVNGKCPNGNYYDLIVSNPPYFQNSLTNPDRGRQTARHTDTLSYAELIKHSVRLLKEDGVLALILPAESEKEVRGLAAAERLSLTRVTRVYSKENKKPKRVLLAFGKGISGLEVSGLEEDVLVLEDEKGGRSAAYSKLCQEFYL